MQSNRARPLTAKMAKSLHKNAVFSKIFAMKTIDPANSPPPPQNLSELKARLMTLRGRSLGQIAKTLGVPLPRSTTHGKGFAGELLEFALGARAHNLPLPDFTDLSIELKSMPVGFDLKPLESTFLCHAPLMNVRGMGFYESPLYQKIALMLFVAVEGERVIALKDRKVLGFYLFKPQGAVLDQIKADYDELMEMVASGHAHDINATIGQIIQMRPKAASGQELTNYITADGKIGKTRPRGFYMRRSFTMQIAAAMFKDQG